jgi:hypothetical protein
VTLSCAKAARMDGEKLEEEGPIGVGGFVQSARRLENGSFGNNGGRRPQPQAKRACNLE